MMWDAHSGMGWWMLFASFWSLLFLALLIGLAVWGSHAFAGTQPGPGRNPLDIAKERYSRGEITREQYDEIRQHLTG